MKTCAGPGCVNLLEGKRYQAVYCSDRCRARAWKKLVKYGRGIRANGSQRGSGGLQVSFYKAARILSRQLNLADDTAEGLLSLALSEKQRERWRDRERS